MKKIILYSLILFALSACQNQEWEFSDYDFNAVYFSYQYPVRTLEMGEDIFDTSLDNEHKCKIMATWGGGYTNGKDVVIDFVVDPSLCNNLTFTNGSDVKAMPAGYYTLASNRISIPQGSIAGGVEVRFTDAFFADPLALGRNYVIPLVMTAVQGADSILHGKSDLPDPNRCIADQWSVKPKDYILYAVKYINTWDAYYLRRGTDVITQDGSTETASRHEQYVENDEVIKLNTLSLSKTAFPLTYKNEAGNNVQVVLTLQFDDSGKCTVTSGSDNISATGTGIFIKKGEKNSWANKDRDALYLDYSVSIGNRQYSTKDTLVVRDRGVAMETFEVLPK